MLPIDRTNKTALDANLVNGNTSDAPVIKSSNDVVYNTIDELNSKVDSLVSAGALSPYPPSFLSRQAGINCNFDVWQRGTSFGSGNNYTADRWAMVNFTGSVSRQAFTAGQTSVPNEPTYFLNMTATSATPFSRIEQRIEDVRSFAGQKVTVSFWAKSSASNPIAQISLQQNFGSGGSASADNINGVSIPLTTSWQKITVTIQLPSISGKTIGANSYLAIVIAGAWTAAVTYNIDIAQVQVNAGNQVLPFQPRSIADELSMCQRYYSRSYDSITSVAGSVAFFSALAGSIAGRYSFPVKMRISPTVTISQNGVANQFRDVATGALVNQAVTSLTKSTTGIESIGVSTGFTVGKMYEFDVDADAEL